MFEGIVSLKKVSVRRAPTVWGNRLRLACTGKWD